MLEKSRVALALILLAASLPVASAEEKPAAAAEKEKAAVEPAAKARPEIADPVVKRLVEEIRKARNEGGLATALVKLDEAKEKAPREPNVLFEQAQIFEKMAKFDDKDRRWEKQAADAYQRVFELGKEKAGVLHELAAKKLAEGP